MNATYTPGQNLAFLLEQRHIVDRKIARLRAGIESAPDMLEAEGLTSLLRAATLGHELLTNLMKQCVDQQPLTLESIIRAEVEALKRNHRPESWRRGRLTSDEYWDAEIKETFLHDLLQRYRACQEGRPLHASTNGQHTLRRAANRFAHPWYPVGSTPATQPQHPRREHSETLKSTITKALDSRGYDDHHLTVVAESDGFVLVTGYAHSTTAREDIIQTILNVEGVREVLACILVNAPEHCLVCKAQRLHLPAS